MIYLLITPDGHFFQFTKGSDHNIIIFPGKIELNVRIARD